MKTNNKNLTSTQPHPVHDASSIAPLTHPPETKSHPISDRFAQSHETFAPTLAVGNQNKGAAPRAAATNTALSVPTLPTELIIKILNYNIKNMSGKEILDLENTVFAGHSLPEFWEHTYLHQFLRTIIPEGVLRVDLIIREGLPDDLLKRITLRDASTIRYAAGRIDESLAIRRQLIDHLSIKDSVRFAAFVGIGVCVSESPSKIENLQKQLEELSTHMTYLQSLKQSESGDSTALSCKNVFNCLKNVADLFAAIPRPLAEHTNERRKLVDKLLQLINDLDR
jgi:hypothetical protein